ncbi:hypothetical protein L9F63_019164 [Diploptera punctata]|uniref:Protein GUCD1 n=1 Tax=Diploptera punctata TaxID=6984 RepID=A0AAD8EEG0_DIPPU|nr:hypothetical protein L9F63_019164 [Diploptera punctata]
MENSESEEDIPTKLEIQLSHHRQRYNWDCGVSCIIMILPKAKRDHLLNNFNKVCAEENFNKSTWSIDLCYMLRRYEVKHLYCTITLGIHPGYHGQTFYEKILQKDGERVMRRFKEAAGIGIKISQKSISCHDLVQHLAFSGPVILLTDASLLQCDVCKLNRLTSELRSCLPWTTNYTGHYIVLCGYNLGSKKFLYHNPSFKKRICMMSFTSLDEARCSYGTDEDAILIYSNT